jgi:predicted LPLAT superfamily acyltransferase
MVQLCLIKNHSTNMHVEVEAEHMVLTKTKCEELLCACIEHVAAWLSKHCNIKKNNFCR